MTNYLCYIVFGIGADCLLLAAGLRVAMWWEDRKLRRETIERRLNAR